MEQSVSVKLTYTPDDSLRVAKLLRNQSFLYRNDVVLTAGIVFVAFIVVSVLMTNDVSARMIFGAAFFSALSAIVVGIAVFVLHKAINPWLMRRTIMKGFDSSPTANKETQLTFSGEGVGAESELTSSYTKWPVISKVIESDSDFLFYSGNKLYWFVPKSAFSSAGDLDLLKDLLRQSLNENANLIVM